MHAPHVSNPACPSICAIEATDLLLLRVWPRPKTIVPHSKPIAGKTNRTCPGGGLSAGIQNPMSAGSGRVNFDHHDVALLTERGAGGDRTLRLNGKCSRKWSTERWLRPRSSRPRAMDAGAQGWPDHLVPAVRQAADDAPSRSRAWCRASPSISVRASLPSVDNQNVAGQMIDQFAKLVGPMVLYARFEHQETAVELDEPLPQDGRFGFRGLGLKTQRMPFEQR